MLYKISLTTAVLALMLTGFLDRLWTSGRESAAAEAAQRIQEVPLILGSWRGQPLEPNAEHIAAAGFAGVLARRYEDENGCVVSMLLVCGPPGPVSVHTPDVCYPGAGFDMIGTQSKLNVPSAGEHVQFWQSQFRKARWGDRRLRVYWSWHSNRGWQAAENPRITFMNLPVLYKLYVMCEIAPGEETKMAEACTRFMKCLLPELEQRLDSAVSGQETDVKGQ
jgi:Protein of unknown function (DUF3485)